MRIRHTIAIAATALALAACTPTEDTGSGSNDPKPASSKPADPSKLDDAGQQACDDFARGYKDGADTKTERLDLAHKVNRSAPSSKTNKIADTGHVLTNGAAGNANTWQLAADTFAEACLDAGWKA